MTIKNSWQAFIKSEQTKDYYKDMNAELTLQRQSGEAIFPPEIEVFSAFSYVELSDVKVVILGQDPYHGEGQAHGLSFSVKPSVKIPPSLANMYKELTTDIDGFVTPEHGFLEYWAKQGVLLLNTVLTVKKAQAHSHAKIGWEKFTDNVIEELNLNNPGCVFILWGAHAKKKGKHLNKDKHQVLTGPHPSPLSAYRGFFGCRHFSKANQWLIDHNQSEINWQLPLKP